MLSPREAGFRQVHTEYRSRAHRLKLEWDLTTDEFFQLLAQPCYYCGTGPGRVIYPSGREWNEEELFICGGVDRLDSSKGYSKTNTVSCCTLCNLTKRNLLPEDFLAHVERIYKHQQSKL